MIQQQINSIINSTLNQMGYDPSNINFIVEPTKNRSHGDFASNVAMVMAKTAQSSPRAFAEQFVAKLNDPEKYIDTVEIAGPGFINFTLTNKFIANVVSAVLNQGPLYGTSVQQHPKKILIEFVSANPTGPLHLGHARGSFMGDALARLFEAAGYDVTREFYVNDVGNQVLTLGRSVYARYRELFGEKIELASDSYPGEYVIDIAQSLKDRDGDKWLNAPEEEWLAECTKFGVEESLQGIKNTLLNAGIAFDNWYMESTLHNNGKVDDLIEAYQARNMLYDAEQALDTDDKKRRDESKAAKYAHLQKGGMFLKTSEFGDDEDRIIVRANGIPVYLAADLAYHKEKYERGFNRVIDVLGADHSGHVPKIRAGMRALGLPDETLSIVLVQMVRLIRGGQELRFSKRSGQIISLKEFLEEVGIDVARFVFLMRSANTQFDFNLDIINAESSENPVFSLQYGHARMATLLKRAEEKGQAFIGKDALSAQQLDHLVLPEEREMLKKIDDFSALVAAAAEALEPHRVIHYCQDLVLDFHSYFTKYKNTHKIISDNIDLTQGRLALVTVLKQTLKNGLSLLGISAPEHMKSPHEHDTHE